MTTLHTNRGPIELEDEHILCNDVVFPWENHPHNMRLWVIGREYGAIVAVWASNEQDAFDEMLDRNYEHFLVADEDFDPALDEEGFYAHLGNAGEACDLSNAWIEPVRLDKVQDFDLILKFAEARGANQDWLWS